MIKAINPLKKIMRIAFLRSLRTKSYCLTVVKILSSLKLNTPRNPKSTQNLLMACRKHKTVYARGGKTKRRKSSGR